MRKLFFALLVLFTNTISAQFISTPPTRDGSIASNEYGNHADGQNSWNDGGRTWYMAWDATNLYLAVNNNGNASNDEFVIYIDTDPALPVTSGTGVNDGIGNFDNVNYGRLPFSANFTTFVRNDYHQHRINTGSTWSTNFNNDAGISKTTAGNTQEIQIAWSLLGGRPSAFNFFIYLNGGSPYGGTSVYNASNDNDQSNNLLNLTGRKYFTVSNTNNGISTPPFSRLSYTNPKAGSNNINNYGNTFYDVTLNIGSTSTLSATLNVDGNLWINDNDALNMNSNAINIKGDLTRKQPVGALSNMGVITFNGTIDQTQNGNVTYNGGLTINKASGKLLLASNGSNTGIIIDNNKTLTLTNGIIDSRTNNTLVEIRTGSSITAGGSSSFIDGNLQINDISSTAKLFPVGRTSYNPATITNTGTADNFTMNVGNYLTLDGSEAGLQTTNQVVNRTWNVSEATAGGSIATLTVQWNSNTPEEMMGFNSASCHVGHYYGGYWQGGVSGAATAGNIANSLIKTRINITDFSPFGVASVGALPISLQHFTAQKLNGYTQLNWTVANESNNKTYAIQSSTDGIRFYSIGTINGIANTNNVNYTYKDYGNYSNKVYYRLAYTETNASIQYSNTISMDQPTASIIILPTATKGIVTLISNLSSMSSVAIYKYDGSLVGKIMIKNGQQNTTIDLSKQPTGIYLINLLENGKKPITKSILLN